ncbi:transposase [Escherichia coli]|uniref:Transposase n=1 Tax=Escherichia coli TaxID=562 RepID=A0A377F5L0_ECOLX|nr:transposase [Escherichia coli]
MPTVERHIRGKWACDSCETLIQAPVPPQVIDKGIPTAGLLAQVLVAKYADHLPLYRQERMFGRAGLEIPRSTLAEWVGACGVQLQPLVDALRNTLLEHSVLHADETPVSMLAPGKKKNPQGLTSGLLHHTVCRPEGSYLRLRTQPCRRTRPNLPG